MAFPILDSHVHLWPSSACNPRSIRWMKPDTPLSRAATAHDYLSSHRVGPSFADSVDGFIYVEVDRSTDSSAKDLEVYCAQPLEEVAFLRRIVEGGHMLEGDETEGFGKEHGVVDTQGRGVDKLPKAAVIWAPMDRGGRAVTWYLSRAKEIAGPKLWPRIKGVRFLLQAIKEEEELRELVVGRGHNNFRDALDVLGEMGLVFEVGVDLRSGGMWQVKIVHQMLERLRKRQIRQGQCVLVLDHLCKPDLTSIHSPDSPLLQEYTSLMKSLASDHHVYVKFSGAFSEMSKQTPDSLLSLNHVADLVSPWLRSVVGAFGIQRLMFGSDWPVCNVVGPGSRAWSRWREVVELLLVEELGASEEEQRAVWAGTAMKVYGI